MTRSPNVSAAVPEPQVVCPTQSQTMGKLFESHSQEVRDFGMPRWLKNTRDFVHDLQEQGFSPSSLSSTTVPR